MSGTEQDGRKAPEDSAFPSIWDFLNNFFEIVEVRAREKFGVSEFGRRGIQDLRQLRLSYLTPGKEDLMKKLRPRSDVEVNSYVEKVAQLIEASDLVVPMNPEAHTPIFLEPQEINGDGARTFWAFQYVQMMIFAGLVLNPWFSVLLKDIRLIEERLGVILGREEIDIRSEEKEDLRVQLSRSLVDVRACIALLERGGPGQYN